MILITLNTLNHHEYLEALSAYALPESTETTKYLGAPFHSGTVSIVYTEPGLTILRSSIRLGREMMILKAANAQEKGVNDQTLHNIGFVSLIAMEGFSFISQDVITEKAVGSKHIATYSCNTAPLLIAYPQDYRSDSLFMQVSGSWLSAHLPDLAPAFYREASEGSKSLNYQAPQALARKLYDYRTFFDAARAYHPAHCHRKAKEFIKLCYQRFSVYASPDDHRFRRDAPLNIRIGILIQEVLSKIHQPLPTLAELSLHFGINAHTLRMTFKKEYGQSIYDYFIEHQMAWAEAALLQPGNSVKTIGAAIGYQNLSHFAHSFKKYRGRLPGDVKPNAKSD